MELLTHHWPWYLAGPALTFVMFGLIYLGGNFGMSNNLRTMCSMGGANRFADFFKIDTKSQYWNLAFLIGSILGGFIAVHFLTAETVIELSPETVMALDNFGFVDAGKDYLPQEIFGLSQVTSLPGFLLLIGGGFLVGFGARYAGGCTSGHAITGLSNLQIPSLIAVLGFFIGGLTMVHLFMPFIF